MATPANNKLDIRKEFAANLQQLNNGRLGSRKVDSVLRSVNRTMLVLEKTKTIFNETRPKDTKIIEEGLTTNKNVVSGLTKFTDDEKSRLNSWSNKFDEAFIKIAHYFGFQEKEYNTMIEYHKVVQEMEELSAQFVVQNKVDELKVAIGKNDFTKVKDLMNELIAIAQPLKNISFLVAPKDPNEMPLLYLAGFCRLDDTMARGVVKLIAAKTEKGSLDASHRQEVSPLQYLCSPQENVSYEDKKELIKALIAYDAKITTADGKNVVDFIEDANVKNEILGFIVVRTTLQSSSFESI